MKKFVVMSGGFHPFHAGHADLYQQAKEAFPDAKVLVCATDVQSDRPYPFSLKKQLAQLSGVPSKDFIEVSRQFTIQDPALAQRIGNPDDAIVIYVRSDKDRNEPPTPWKLGPDGKPPVGKRGAKKGLPLSNYLLEYPGEGQPLDPVSKHAYMDYLKTVEFGPGITSASEIRNAWPKLNEKRKLAMVMSLYPTTKSNPQLAQNVVGMFDQVMGNELDEGIGSKLGAAALAGSLALGGLSSMGKTTNTNWDNLPQQMSTQKDSRGGEKIMSVTGPNNKGEYRVRVTIDNDIQEYITKTPPKSLREAINKVEPIANPVPIQKTITQPKQHIHSPPEKKTPAAIIHINKKEVKEADAKIFHPQYVDVYYLDGPRRTPILVNRKVPYKLIDRYLEVAIKKYNLQQGRFEFRNAEEKVAEGLGIPYPTTYEQENNKFKRRGPMRITNMTEFATPGSDDREPDEEEILRQLAAQWWNGTEQQMKKAQQTLQAMGWEIGQDESGDDDAGVFVIRIGDKNGDSYIAFPHSELGLNEDYLNEI